VIAADQRTAPHSAAALTWRRLARRVRVPLGFCLAAVYLWIAHPTWAFLAGGAGLVALGLALRAAASGHVRKNSELTITGPYRYTRNPLYLGSLIMGCGFALAARSWWTLIAITLLFFAVYWPVILSEEEFLRAHFGTFDEYARRVPRLLPKLRPRGQAGSFSRELYRQHREYNALLGAVALLLALAEKIAKLGWRS
jgi:protein-S-isoprenylcysteine O-methyltransferase Ste14